MARIPKALLIDLSGTLHVGSQPTPNARDALRRLRDAGIVLRFVSNTSKESRSALLAKMQEMQLDVREEEASVPNLDLGYAQALTNIDGWDLQLFTSLSAVRDLVAECRLRPFYLLSNSAREDFPSSRPPFDSVVVGLAPTAFEYDKLNEAFRLLAGEEDGLVKGQVPLIVTHKAKFVQADDGKLSLGPGPFVTALEEAASCTAEIVGKPSQGFYRLALDSFASSGIQHRDVAMIGDDVYQDCGPAVARLGLQRFLVKTGKYRPGDEDRLSDSSNLDGNGGAPRPDLVCETFADAVDLLLDG
ncbi:hypothetical protein JCM10212_003513 [Sporobolomyces blumeae]